MVTPGVVLGSLLAIGAVLALAGPAPAPEWPGKDWNTKLAQERDQWRPMKDVLVELSKEAGGPAVVCPDDAKNVVMIPLLAGLTLKEAFLNAAACCACDVTLEDGKLVVRKGASRGDSGWVAAIGGQTRAIDFDDVHGFLFEPRDRKAGPMPWVWYAPSQGLWSANAWITRRLFAEGVALAMVDVGESAGSPKGRRIYQAFYEKLVKDHRVARKAVLLPQSRGGLMLYNWAAEHAECVQAVGGIYPVCDLRGYSRLPKLAETYGMTPEELEAQLDRHNPIARLEPLAKAGVRIFHIHGDQDTVVPLEKNSAELVRRYKALGGQAELEVIRGKGHEVAAEFFQCRSLADFLVREAKASVAPPPDSGAAGAEGDKPADAKNPKEPSSEEPPDRAIP